MRLTVYLIALVAVIGCLNFQEAECDPLGDGLAKAEDLKKAEEKAAKNKGPKNGVESKISAFLGSNRDIKLRSLSARVQLNVLKAFREESGLSGKAFWKAAKKRFGKGILHPKLQKIFHSDQEFPLPIRFDYCPFPNVECNVTDSLFRTADGTCNNLQFPLQGSANRAYARWLFSDYNDDIEEPRGGDRLPSARKVSTSIHSSSPLELSPVNTVLHMTFGQILDHDTDRTGVSKYAEEDTGELVDFECGSDGCQTEGEEHSECFPIPVPDDDADFNKTKKPCIMFVRSQEYLDDDCAIGPRQQANSITAWTDASMVYGSNKKETDFLRDFTDTGRGIMRTSEHPFRPDFKPLLPTQVDKACRGTNATIQCFKAGDARQNEQVALTSMHTMFVRLHNYIEENLHAVNPHWDGERLFQESRKLLIALWQNMVYGEYLPILLGPDYMDTFDLWVKSPGKYKGYNEYRTADISNQFSTASFRFGHSQITDFLSLVSPDFKERVDVPFCSLLFRPTAIYETHFDGVSGMDAIMLGNAFQQTDKADRFFTEEMSKRMFTETPPHGLGSDLAARNNQRGRDHGLPDYLKWRAMCKLSVGTDFDELDDIPADVQNILRGLYDSVHDIDLFAAAMTEEHVPGGIVGPTFACLLARQFRDLKQGDRFWFENYKNFEKTRFSKAQLKNIMQYTTGRFYCDTLDNVEKIQKYAMLRPIKDVLKTMKITRGDLYQQFAAYKGSSNKRVPCKKHKGINFDLWKEEY